MFSRQIQLLLGTWICLTSAGLISAASTSPGDSHWAFQPVTDPPAPTVTDENRVRTSLDRFVLSRLEARGLGFSPAADRTTLIRRATFDLTGLPPTPEEVDEFLTDSSPAAYDRVIDRLLQSPHYGEHWGRHWLDVARYADNKGYVFFEEKTFPWAYTYRDYVVDAFNRDLPYNQFILEQLAADQLDLGPDKRALAAMGFLTLGGRFMGNLHDVLDDRIDVTTRGLLGLTASCARCHDHKYDPIPQADYYSLYGVFRNSVEPILPPLFGTPPDTESYKKFDIEMKVRTGNLHAFVTGIHSNIVKDAHFRLSDYLLAAHAQHKVPSAENFMLITDKGDLNPSVIQRWKVYLDKHRDHPIWRAWQAFADLPDQEFSVQGPGMIEAMARVGPGEVEINGLVLDALVNSPPQSRLELAQIYAALFRQAEDDITGDRGACQSTAMQQIREFFQDPNAPTNIPRQLGWGFISLLPDRATQEEFKKLIKEVETWSMTGPSAPARAMVLNDTSEVYEPRIFVRGNPHQPGQAVPRRFLNVLDKEGRAFGPGSGRLDLARAIVDPANPLTARVIVNRVWRHHFGRGLVTTPSDFGLRSNPPTHPDLLDHLATVFIKQGWSFKRLHRLIMLSAVYRQASTSRPQALSLDPENQLLWKFNRRRLQFEALRDSLLAVSGKLDPALGGPAEKNQADAQAARRTLYGFIDRMDLPGLYRAYDFPDPAATCPKRDQTTIAPQALYLMNHPFAKECARHLVARPDIARLTDPAKRLEGIYQWLFARIPTASEQTLAREFLAQAGPDHEKSWIQYTHALMMANEFIFID
jgi:hypothetical protein